MLYLLLVSLVALGISAMAAESGSANKKGKLRHVVAFKFKDTASKEDIKKVEDAFRGLKAKIPAIVGYEWGTNNSPENLNRGCTHGFILTFNSEKDRDDYLVHPELPVTLGLGKESKVESLEITWPSGKVQKVEPVLGQTISVTESD